jgi:hypothetical protein
MAKSVMTMLRDGCQITRGSLSPAEERVESFKQTFQTSLVS